MTNSTFYRTYHMRVNINQENIDTLQDMPGYMERMANTVQKNWLKFFAHAALLIFLYSLPFLLSLAGYPYLQGSAGESGSAGDTVSFIFLTGFAYFNFYVLVPRFYLQKNFIAWFGVTGIFAFALIIVRRLASQVPEDAVLTGPQVQLNYFLVLFIASISAPVIIRQHMLMEKREQAMVQMKMSALNAQINPHFLFNSLNWIYSLAIREPHQAPGAIIQLSGLMRYLVKDAQTNFADLKSELHYIGNYLEVQAGRLDDTITLQYAVPAYNGSLRIAPLVAMSFIENAFKYGINPDEDSVISINITVTGNRFCLQVINNKVSMMNAVGNGLGIENTRQRLQLLYPGLHELEILDNDTIYSVNLSILLQ